MDFGRSGIKDLPVLNDEKSSSFSSVSEEGFITSHLHHDVDPICLDLRDLFKTTSPKYPRCRTRKDPRSMSMDEIDNVLVNVMKGA